MDKALNLLNKYYGYKEFRKGQDEIISKIVKGNDVLGVMPTGAGKSICYQIPALIFEGVTLVISPLISLMKDQVDSLKTSGINAAFINSTLDSNELEAILYDLRNNKIKILYVAPERLDSLKFIEIIKNINVSQIAIDEAHCVSQWGHDFRQSYRKIADFISKFKIRPVITAFTATASNEVREDIIRLLRLRNPEVFVSGFDRENLTINIIKDGSKARYLKEYVKNNCEESGIIYCATRKEVDKIYEELNFNGYRVGKYHAGLSDEERKNYQENFINDEINIMVATNAFGMGIDKPNIRYVIHNNMPQSIEAYYQEIGRAGRDGEKSECILLFTPGDIHMQKFLIENGVKNEIRREIAFKKLQDMVDLVYSSSCYRKFILNYFGEELKEDCNNCNNCLSEGEVVDKTIDAQKVLSCIGRMKRGYGTNMVVDVLRGSKNRKIIALGFDELSTYGIMKNYKKEELISFINTLISHGYLDHIEGTYPVIRLNSRSVSILKGELKVKLKENKVKESIFVHNELFDILKELRYKIAKEENLPPYVIFGDKTLNEMCMLYPTSEEDLLNISGIGEVKIKKYGKKFNEVIEKYVLENDIKKARVNTNLNTNDRFDVVTNEKLYANLRALREKFANKENKLPSYIISQNTLKEISGRYPLDEKELNDISGLGPKKIDMYGDEILHLVNEFVRENSIECKFEYRDKRKLVIDGEGRKNDKISIALLEEGIDINTISERLEVSIATILGYVTNYINENNKILFKIDLSQFYNEIEEKEILNACKEYGIDKVSAIKKHVERTIKYEAIRAVILKHYYNIC